MANPLTFSIINGIPCFVQAGSYAAAFGPQWLKYRQTQLDSFTGASLSADRARRCIGEVAWWAVYLSGLARTVQLRIRTL